MSGEANISQEGSIAPEALSEAVSFDVEKYVAEYVADHGLDIGSDCMLTDFANGMMWAIEQRKDGMVVNLHHSPPVQTGAVGSGERISDDEKRARASALADAIKSASPTPPQAGGGFTCLMDGKCIHCPCPQLCHERYGRTTGAGASLSDGGE